MSTLTVGQKIRKARRDLDMTQEDLAKKLNTTKATINRYELGVVANIPRSKLRALAEALQIDPEELFDYETTANTQRQQLQNIDNEIKIIHHDLDQIRALHGDPTEGQKKLDSALTKRNHILAEIARLDLLIKRDQEAEEASTPRRLEEIIETAEAEEQTEEIVEPERRRVLQLKVSEEELELLRIYRELSVRRRMQLLNYAYSLEDEEK